MRTSADMPRSRRVLAFAAAAASAVLLAPAPLLGGCLAPSDRALDNLSGVGPLWGNDSGSILDSRLGLGGAETLTLRAAGGAPEDVAVSGDSNDFFVGTSRERWDVFVAGTVNADDDLAFVAATKISDDPGTPQNEAISRRGAYARVGNTMYELARFGGDSPVNDAFQQPVPWGSVFDAVAADRDDTGRVPVVFSGQLGGAVDRRTGLFRWNDAAPGTVTPALLTGDIAPSGGTFVSLGRLRGNGPGDAAFFAVTRLTDTSPQIPGLFVLRGDGQRARVVKFGTEGDAAPGGGTLAVAADFDIDDAGVVHFTATVAGGASPTALFRAAPPLYAPERVLGEGDPTPFGGTFGSFARAAVRANADGSVAFSLPLSEDLRADGLFTLAAGSSDPQPLASANEIIAIAAVGAGRAAYSTGTQIRLVVPADGSEQGPTDFRIAKLDLRNSVPLRSDSIRFDGRFTLPAWNAVAPATFRADATRFTPTQTLTGSALTVIREAKVVVSAAPGNNFVLGIGGTDDAPVGSFKFNGQPQTVNKLKIDPDGSSATWSFSGSPGPGSLTVDLAAGTFSLKVSAATIQPSYEAPNFRVALFLRSQADVQQGAADADSFFARDLRIAGNQPGFGQGRRVTSSGEGTAGGTVFVDSLRVTRKVPAGGGAPADAIVLAGTLRLCPGSTPPVTPTVAATLHVGSFALNGITMTRMGKSPRYRYVGDGVEFRVDLVKSTFALKGTVPALAELASAEPGSATNGPEHEVGGMTLDFALSVARVYDVAFPVPMVRLTKGKVFSR
jgi:hypothetical protein